MAFRATNIIPEQGFGRAKSLCERLKRFCDSRSSEYASGANSERILTAMDTLINFRTELNVVKSTPRIAQYAKDQEGDQNYDVAAEFIAVIALLDIAIASIITAFPRDGNDYLLAETMDANGVRAPRNFTSGALSGIRTDLDAVAAGIS